MKELKDPLGSVLPAERSRHVEWNPVKELKVLCLETEFRQISIVVESGEGIERNWRKGRSCSGSATQFAVESGEGIESLCRLVSMNRPSCWMWNPVKELKDLDRVIVPKLKSRVESGEGIERTWEIWGAGNGLATAA